MRSVISVTVCRPSCSCNSRAFQGVLSRATPDNSHRVTGNSHKGSTGTHSDGTPHLFPCVFLAYVRHQSGRTPNPAADRIPRKPTRVRQERGTHRYNCLFRSPEQAWGLVASPRDRASPARTRQLTSQAPERNSPCPRRVSTAARSPCASPAPSPSPEPVAPLSLSRSSVPPAPTPLPRSPFRKRPFSPFRPPGRRWPRRRMLGRRRVCGPIR